MERRKQYRIKIGDEDGFEVGILLDDGSVVVGQSLDLMVDGAGVRFTRPGCPTLEMGHPVMLRFMSDKLDAPVEPGLELAGQPARFLVKDDGDHYFQLVPDRWDWQSLFRSIKERMLSR